MSPYLKTFIYAFFSLYLLINHLSFFHPSLLMVKSVVIKCNKLQKYFSISNLNTFFGLIFIGCVVMKLNFIGSSNPTERRT